MKTERKKGSGGKRVGSGRKSDGKKRKPYAFKLSVDEHAAVKEFIKSLRSV